jgi:outer membrane protein assembly factor BamB
MSVIERSSKYVLIVALMGCAAWRCGAAISYGPPDVAVDVAGELRVLEREIAERNYGAAARRFGTLLAANRGDALTEVGPGTLCTIWAWMSGLPQDARDGMAQAARAEHEEGARRALEGLMGSTSARAEEWFAVARRYPLTRSAGAALVLAGDRSMEAGDFPGARALYELAARDGALLDEVRAKRVELIKRVGSGDFLPMPADLTGEGSGAVRGKKLLFGGMAFDAPWYGGQPGTARFFPAACGDGFVVASWKSVSLLRETGQMVWTSTNPKPSGSFSIERSRGLVFGASVLADVHGRPTIVVVRQPTALEGQYALRAYRGSDGKLLWASELLDGQRKDLTYVGLPVVCGRYVYGVTAARTDRSSGTLLLSAVDVTSGEAIWQASLGSIIEQSIDERGGKKNIVNQPLDLTELADVTEPAVVEDLVVVSPGCGAVMAVGRFDGKVRWVHTYGRAEEPRVRDRRGREVERVVAPRYGSTPAACERAVVVLPRDSGKMIGLDRATGKRLWQKEALEAYGLAGAVVEEDVAVVRGTTVWAVDALTGEEKWKYGATRLTGPAAVAGRTVMAPVASGVVQLDGVSGEVKSVYNVPDLRRALRAEGARAVLREAGAERAIGGR